MTTFDLSPVTMQALAVQVSPTEASHVLWHFGETAGALEPGSFTTRLLAACTAADPINLRRLGLGFPGYAAAVALAQGSTQGIAVLRVIAGIQLCATCSGTGMVKAAPPVVRDGAARHLDTCPACKGHRTLRDGG